MFILYIQTLTSDDLKMPSKLNGVALVKITLKSQEGKIIQMFSELKEKGLYSKKNKIHQLKK